VIWVAQDHNFVGASFRQEDVSIRSDSEQARTLEIFCKYVDVKSLRHDGQEARRRCDAVRPVTRGLRCKGRRQTGLLPVRQLRRARRRNKQNREHRQSPIRIVLPIHEFLAWNLETPHHSEMNPYRPSQATRRVSGRTATALTSPAWTRPKHLRLLRPGSNQRSQG